MNVKNSLKETYNKIAERWHKEHRTDDWWVKGINKFVSLVKKDGLILDVGCGDGMKSKYLLENGLRVIGIDFSEKMIELAKREVKGVDFLVMDMKDIDELEENFEGVFIQAALLHIPKKEAEGVLKKTAQKLKQGGYLYVAVKEKREKGLDEEIKIDNDYGYECERFFSYFTAKEVKTYFKNSGFKEVFFEIMPSGKTHWITIIGKKL